MKSHTPLFWIQSAVLVMPIGFLLAGGCGGGSNGSSNGGFFGSPPAAPVVIAGPTATPTATASPTATLDPSTTATPVPDATTDPLATATPISTSPTATPDPTVTLSPTATPISVSDFSFSTKTAVPSQTSLKLFLSATTQKTLTIAVPRRADGTNALGQTFNATLPFLLAEFPRAEAGVTYVEGNKTYNSISGTVIISAYQSGVIGTSPVGQPDLPGRLTFQLSEVVMARTTDPSDIFIITGPFMATSGSTMTNDFGKRR